MVKKESKRQYLDRRRQRVRELFRFEGLQPREITERLVKDGTIETTDESLESALRLVRSDVAEIRAEINDERAEDAKPERAPNAVDALERELSDLREEFDFQKKISRDDSTVMQVMDTPNGTMTIEKWRWPPGTRQKASKDAAILKEKISKLEIVLTEKRAEIKPAAKGERPADDDAIFRVVTSGKSLGDLVADNATGSDSGEVN